MANPHKYDQIYANERNALGEPFAEVMSYFKNLDRTARVLDLGAGQGRDALALGRSGFTVHAVDMSEIGLAQLQEDAQAESLSISVECADLAEFTPSSGYDVLLADRTFHMLAQAPRHACLSRCLGKANGGAHALIIDELPNLAGLRKAFDEDNEIWHTVLDKKGFLFFRQGA